nr:PREDICTED: uncharacterized protein LOC100882692 isoform X3 [Megachile rotundata]
MSGEQFSLVWNSFPRNLSSGLYTLLTDEQLVDVTLAAEGQILRAHKLILSVCSTYFRELFKENSCKHPIVILKDVNYRDLSAMLHFMYQGEVNIKQEDIASFLKVAETLQIKGLTTETEEKLEEALSKNAQDLDQIFSTEQDSVNSAKSDLNTPSFEKTKQIVQNQQSQGQEISNSELEKDTNVSNTCCQQHCTSDSNYNTQDIHMTRSNCSRDIEPEYDEEEPLDCTADISHVESKHEPLDYTLDIDVETGYKAYLPNEPFHKPEENQNKKRFFTRHAVSSLQSKCAISTICSNMVQKSLGQFRKMEVPERCGGRRDLHPHHFGPISKSPRSIAENIRGHLIHLTSSRRFLRAGLSTRCGLYVWKDLDYFSVDNQLLNSPCSFRGRPITESNIQDYVSDLTSKFFPPGQPPWQVHVINCFLRGEEYQVCLVRVHHLLLRQEHLALADFLPLRYSTDGWTCQDPDSPFTNLYAEPAALPKLYQKLTESFSNYWNEFLYNNDPNERPEILKKQIGSFQCAKIGVIVLVSSLKELTRRYRKGEKRGFFEVFSILQREANKRSFGPLVFLRALLKSMNPFEAIYYVITWLWYLAITLTLKTPILLLRELRALKSRHKHYYPDTLTSMLWYYVPLVFQASMEVLSITWIAIKAPKMILEELFLKHPQANRLQTTSPCGRKVVAWSEEVEFEVLRKISSMTGATEAEILLAATVDALKEYFRHSEVRIPDDVLATGKFTSQRAIFVQNHEPRGVLCLALPTRTPLFEDDLVEILQVIQKNVREARSKQSALYAITAAEASVGLISSCLPSLMLKVLLNQLTRRYSLSLTHVDGDLPVEGVDAVMYWRPPQGNCNMSITLHRYGNGVRMGVMGDALIGPEHSIITRTFPKSVENLANVVGVPRTPSRNSTPSPASPSTSPGH